MPSFTRPSSSQIDYNAVTGDSITTAAQKHDIAVDDLYTNIVDGTASVKGIVQLGTTATTAALGNHLHTGTYAPAAEGVTNGNTHDHGGGDGAQIAYSTLSGLPILGTASAIDVGTTANKIVQLDANARLPAVPGDLLTGIGDVARAYTKQQAATVVALTSQSGSISVNADDHQDLSISATGNITLGAPSNSVTGRYIALTLYAASALTITWNGVYKRNSDVPLPTAFVAGKTTILSFRCYDGTNWLLMGKVQEE